MVQKSFVPRTNADDINAWVAYPFELWWRDALSEAFAGGNVEQILLGAQAKVPPYLSCILAQSNREFNQAVSCARQVDPEFSPSS